MNSDVIYRKADNLVRQVGTRDAERIANEIGICIYIEDSFEELLGMYTFRWNHRLMFLNQRMNAYLRKMVIAHELGHDALHRDKAKQGMKEFTLFSIKDTTEYEANAFAAHILLDSDEVYHYAKMGYDVEQMSRTMGTNVNLMLIKLQEMNRLGYDDLRVPYDLDSKFFRKIHV